MSFEKGRNDLEFFSKPDLPVWTFGPFRVEPAEGRVLRDGRPVALTPKAFDLLVLLLRHRGHLVTREALLSRLWPDTFVDESNLTGAIWAVRKALGNRERWIETVPNTAIDSWDRCKRPVSPLSHVPPHWTGPSPRLWCCRSSTSQGTPNRSISLTA